MYICIYIYLYIYIYIYIYIYVRWEVKGTYWRSALICLAQIASDNSFSTTAATGVAAAGCIRVLLGVANSQYRLRARGQPLAPERGRVSAAQ